MAKELVQLLISYNFSL